MRNRRINRLRLLVDLLTQLCSLENSKYMQYSFAFQTFICAKISHHQHLPMYSLVTSYKVSIVPYIIVEL